MFYGQICVGDIRIATRVLPFFFPDFYQQMKLLSISALECDPMSARAVNFCDRQIDAMKLAANLCSKVMHHNFQRIDNRTTVAKPKLSDSTNKENSLRIKTKGRIINGFLHARESVNENTTCNGIYDSLYEVGSGRLHCGKRRLFLSENFRLFSAKISFRNYVTLSAVESFFLLSKILFFRRKRPTHYSSSKSGTGA